MIKSAVDTNVLIYLHEINPLSNKRIIASEILLNEPFVSSQVISEYLNVCHRKLRMTKDECLDSLMGWLPFCNLTPFDVALFNSAIELVKKYQFQMFDSIIVASALNADCRVLFSEDMQHNLLVEGKLQITNPFI